MLNLTNIYAKAKHKGHTCKLLDLEKKSKLFPVTRM